MKYRILLLALASSGFASAASTFSTQSFSFVPNGSQTLNLNKFDTTLGTLTGVTVTTTFTKTGGSVSGDNDSASSATVDFTSQTVGNISSTVVQLLNVGGVKIFGATAQDLDVSDTATLLLQPTTGDSMTQFDNTGKADFAVYNGITGTATSSGTVGAAYWAAYCFAGHQTFAVKMNAQNLSGISSVSGVQYAVVAPTVSGDVTVTYTYTAAIPESSAALLGGLGMLTLLRRRR